MTGIWGIVNVTPDSFSDGGRYLDVDRAVAHALRLRAEGAAVLDVGGESTRPGADRVGDTVEQQRVIPVIEQLAAGGVPVSVDTLSASTAAAAVRAGARIVNDVSGGLADPDMRAAVAESGADFAIGHWRGFSADMYAKAEYRRVAREVAGELQERIGEAAASGIARRASSSTPASGSRRRVGRTGMCCGDSTRSSPWGRECSSAPRASGSSRRCCVTRPAPTKRCRSLGAISRPPSPALSRSGQESGPCVCTTWHPRVMRSRSRTPGKAEAYRGGPVR